MGVQQISEKKTKLAASETGLPIFRALRHSNRLWFCFCHGPWGVGHWHVAVDPVTWEWYTNTENAFSSCPEYGEHVPPPPGIALAGSLPTRVADAEDSVKRLTDTLRFYADERNWETRQFDSSPDLTINPIEEDRGALARAVLAGEGG